MRTIIAISTALLVSTAIPITAGAQILGGGLGGGIGGTLNGTVGGTLGGAGGVGSTLDSVSSGTSGTLRGASSSTGSQSVDRKSGRVKADRRITANGGGNASSSITNPVSSLTSGASGNGNVAGSGAADAQIIGTDAVRGTVQSVRGTVQTAKSDATLHARNTAGSAQGRTEGLFSGTSGLLGGSLTGSGSASGSGSAGSTGRPISGSASGSGSANGGFTVRSGMAVLSPDGERIGQVRQVLSNARGEAQQLLVKVDGQLAALPATNFSASGNAVMSAMGEGQIKQIGNQQQAAQKQ